MGPYPGWGAGWSELSFIHRQEKKNVVFCPQRAEAFPQKWEEFPLVPRGRNSLLAHGPLSCIAEGVLELDWMC